MCYHHLRCWSRIVVFRHQKNVSVQGEEGLVWIGDSGDTFSVRFLVMDKVV